MMTGQMKWKETHAYHVLSNLIDQQKYPQNLLFTGSDTAVKADLTTYYLQERFCENRKGQPCYVCQACKLIATDQHPDVYIYEVGAKFGKDEMRDLQSKMSESGLMGVNRAYVIKQLDILTPQAQNAWLKFLEEPLENTYCIAWIENENQILPTVKSRFLTLFVRNERIEDKGDTPPLQALAKEFLNRYESRATSADLMLFLDKNMKVNEMFSSFIQTLYSLVIERGEFISFLPLISKVQKMINAHVAEDQAMMYFCINIYREE